MEIILEQAKVIFPGDPLDQKRVNIVIKNGIIEKIIKDVNTKNHTEQITSAIETTNLR